MKVCRESANLFHVLNLRCLSLILHIETSSPVGSVCLSENNKVIGNLILQEQNSHAAKLTLTIEQLMKTCGYKLHELDAVSYSRGPGSYTGLRIGLSTAKGICYALNKPLIAVSTLQALCTTIGSLNKGEPTHLLPMLDARRNDAYTALYDSNFTEIIAPQMVTVDQEFVNRFSEYPMIYYFGSGADKLNKYVDENKFQLFPDVVCKAEYLVPFAVEKLKHEKFENLALSEPLYINEMQKISK